MKKVFLLLAAAFFYFGNSAQAQTNSVNSAGLMIDFGDGTTLVGPSIKHYFDSKISGQAELLFGGGATFLGAYYQYNDKIQNAAGLGYYIGAGPMLGFGNGNTDFYIRPMAGLDYKLSDSPINLTFDWRPLFYVGDNSNFTAGRFGLGVRFAF